MAFDDDVEMTDVGELDSEGDIKMISPVRPVAPKTTAPRAAASNATGASATTSRAAASTSTAPRNANANATASRPAAANANASRTTASNNAITARTPASNATSSGTAAPQATPARAAASNTRTPAATSRQPVQRALRSGGQLKKASHRVLNNEKLLEKILCKLPWVSLFKIQRTSKTFRKTIKESHLLQGFMFLRKRTNEEVQRASRRRSGNPANPILNNSIFFPRLAVEPGTVEGIHLVIDRQLQWCFRREYDPEHPAPITDKCIKLANREASWRKMFVYRGDAALFWPELKMLYHHPHQKTWNKVVRCGSYNGRDATLGQVLDGVEDRLNKYWDWRIKGAKLPGEMRDVTYKPPNPPQGNVRR